MELYIYLSSRFEKEIPSIGIFVSEQIMNETNTARGLLSYAHIVLPVALFFQTVELLQGHPGHGEQNAASLGGGDARELAQIGDEYVSVEDEYETELDIRGLVDLLHLDVDDLTLHVLNDCLVRRGAGGRRVRRQPCGDA